MSRSMRESLENVYRSHRQGLFSYALSVSGSRQIAEDSIQTTFANLFRRADELSVLTSEGLVAYAYKSVRNGCIDLCRGDQRRKKLSEVLFAEYREASDSPEATFLTRERNQILQSAIDELGEHDREAIVLKAFSGLTFEQAGEVLNVSPKTVATRYRRALEKLQNHLRGKL